jgi:cyclohexanecarboxylate-CoA ligase
VRRGGAHVRPRCVVGSLVQHCRSQGLSRYKHPERLVIVDALPRNQFGKVIKKDLREAFG